MVIIAQPDLFRELLLSQPRFRSLVTVHSLEARQVTNLGVLGCVIHKYTQRARPRRNSLLRCGRRKWLTFINAIHIHVSKTLK